MRLPTLSPSTYRHVTLGALLALIFIIVTGAGVRLTGSGLGCPTWPNCEAGSLTPRSATSTHAMIEFVNRTITGLVSVSVALAVAGSLRRIPYRRDLVNWSLSLVAGVIGQIVLGGLTVLFELSPPFVMAHFLLSIVLVFCAVVLHHKAGQPDVGHVETTATPSFRRGSTALVALCAAILFLGTVVTGAGPHGGDEDVARLDLDIGSVARVHAVFVWLFLAVALGLVRWANRGMAGRAVESRLRVLIGATVLQGAIGYTQYFTGVPESLVALHVLGSVVVFIATVRVHLATSQVVARTPAPMPVAV